MIQRMMFFFSVCWLLAACGIGYEQEEQRGRVVLRCSLNETVDDTGVRLKPYERIVWIDFDKKQWVLSYFNTTAIDPIWAKSAENGYSLIEGGRGKSLCLDVYLYSCMDSVDLVTRVYYGRGTIGKQQTTTVSGLCNEAKEVVWPYDD